MVNRWVQHIKKFANEHNLSYGCALSDPQCKATYISSKPLTRAKEQKGMEAEDVSGQYQRKADKSAMKIQKAFRKTRPVGVTIEGVMVEPEKRSRGRPKGSKNKAVKEKVKITTVRQQKREQKGMEAEDVSGQYQRKAEKSAMKIQKAFKKAMERKKKKGANVEELEADYDKLVEEFNELADESELPKSTPAPPQKRKKFLGEDLVKHIKEWGKPLYDELDELGGGQYGRELYELGHRKFGLEFVGYAFKVLSSLDNVSGEELFQYLGNVLIKYNLKQSETERTYFPDGFSPEYFVLNKGSGKECLIENLDKVESFINSVISPFISHLTYSRQAVRKHGFVTKITKPKELKPKNVVGEWEKVRQRIKKIISNKDLWNRIFEKIEEERGERGGKLLDAIKLAPALIKGRDNLPPDVKGVLERDGDAVITGATIFRTPLSSALNFALNIASLGQFKKKLAQSPYDKLFHLGLILETSKGPFTTEKEAVIRLRKGKSGLTNKTETMPLDMNGKSVTLNQLFEGGIKSAGSLKTFISYQSKSNNCQNYVMFLMNGSGLGSQQNREFVKQDTAKLFEGMDWFRKLTNSVTGIGEKVDIIQQGGMMAGVGRILANALIAYVRGRIRERAITLALDFLRENGIDLRQYGQQVQQRFIEEVERVRQQIINGAENAQQIRIPREIADDWELVEEDPDWEIVGKRRTNGKGGYRPITQRKFHSLSPEHQHHHIQLAHKHHLAGGKVPRWLQKVGNFAKGVGKTALKVAKNPLVQKLALGALTTAVPELAPFTVPLSIGTKFAVNQANKAVGQGRKMRGGADEEEDAEIAELMGNMGELSFNEKEHHDRFRPIEVNKIVSIAREPEKKPEKKSRKRSYREMEGKGRLSKKEKYYQEHNPYEHLKEGAFTKELKAFNKKHGEKYNLEQFAKDIARFPEHFKPITRKRALFYLNMIKHTPTHLK